MARQHTAVRVQRNAARFEKPSARATAARRAQQQRQAHERFEQALARLRLCAAEFRSCLRVRQAAQVDALDDVAIGLTQTHQRRFEARNLLVQNRIAAR